MTLYGIRNCDSCRAASKWLSAAGIEFRFHDLRKDGIERAQVERWLASCDRERLLNRRGTTWRQLDESERSRADGDQLADLLLAHPTLIKRPVLEHSTGVEIGFSAARYEAILSGAD